MAKESPEIGVKVYPEGNRRELAEMLSHWHSSMGDPIYACGSSWMDKSREVALSTVEGCLGNIEKDISVAKTKAGRERTGWGDSEIAELQKIARMLQKSIDHAIGNVSKKVDLDAFFDAYVTTALWAETDNADESGGSPLDANYGPGDIAKASLKKMRKDTDGFAKENAALILGREELAGHDFWLTRNGHGAGFWDGDWPKRDGEILTKASKAYGGSYIYVGDDKKIHVD